MRERRWLSWLVAAVMSAGLSGCADGVGQGPPDNRPQGGQIGGVYRGCDWEAEDIDADDVSPLGFSARDVASAVSGERSVPLLWRGDKSTTATFSVGELVAARLVRSTEPDPGESSGSTELYPSACSDHVQVDVPLAFSTEDGVFDESLVVKLRAYQPDVADFVHWFDLAALQGSYEITEIDPAEFREVRVHLYGKLSPGAIEGSIGGRGDGYPIGGRPEGSVYSGYTELFDVAEF
ncbi:MULTISPECIES: hypothetical protein [Sorangium]|uniref:Secreted protein n=1 Tax=Sorangium cellulosum (strain So ce56) TaxID=448385 RepID=A9GN29_SORC5|nr:hypothetical protein [Sorangium cellulosum]CAN93521.1 hypothetical protein predicted by Glimmer/Critica [Sorangium cellulosum So ce56]